MKGQQSQETELKMGVLRCGSQPRALWSGVGRGEGGRRATSSRPTREGLGPGWPWHEGAGPQPVRPAVSGSQSYGRVARTPFPTVFGPARLRWGSGRPCRGLSSGSS